MHDCGLALNGEARIAGRTNLDFSVEPAWTTERRVDRVRPICRRHHDDPRAPVSLLIPALADVYPVHLGQERSHHSSFDAPSTGIFPPRTHSVDFVQDDNAGAASAGIGKDRAEASFGFAMEGAGEFGATDSEQRSVCGFGDRARKVGFAGSRGTVQKDAFWRFETFEAGVVSGRKDKRGWQCECITYQIGGRAGGL